MSNFTGYTIAAKPVVYGGIHYRSRLEATWAAFFDVFGWRYEYEPRDFNGWYPDFALLGPGGVIYAEVKPVHEFPENVARKIEDSGCDDETLILGLGPIEDPGCMGDYHLGWLREVFIDENDERHCHWALAPFTRCRKGELTPDTFPQEIETHWDFFHRYGSYRARYCGWYDGDAHLSPDDGSVRQLWGAAKLATRFEKRG